MNGEYYVYCWYYLDTKQIFYVGKGKGNHIGLPECNMGMTEMKEKERIMSPRPKYESTLHSMLMEAHNKKQPGNI